MPYQNEHLLHLSPSLCVTVPVTVNGLEMALRLYRMGHDPEFISSFVMGLSWPQTETRHQHLEAPCPELCLPAKKQPAGFKLIYPLT